MPSTWTTATWWTLARNGHTADKYLPGVSLRRKALVSVCVTNPLLTCSLARSAGRSGPEDFVGLTGLAAPALLGWGLRVTVS